MQRAERHRLETPLMVIRAYTLVAESLWRSCWTTRDEIDLESYAHVDNSQVEKGLRKGR